MLLRCQNSTQNETLIRTNLSAPPDVDLIVVPDGARSVDMSRCNGEITMVLSTVTEEWEGKLVINHNNQQPLSLHLGSLMSC